MADKKTDTWAARIPVELKERLQAEGWTGEKVTPILQAALEGAGASPLALAPQAGKELQVLGEQLQGVLDRVYSLQTLASQNQARAKAEVDEAKAELIQIKADRAERIEALTRELTESQALAENLDKALAEAKGQAEDVAALREAWEQQRADLNARVAELDAEAKQTRALKDAVAKAEKALADAEHGHAMALKDAALDKAQAVAQAKEDAQAKAEKAVTDARDRADRAIAQAKADLDKAKEDAQAQAEELADIKAELAGLQAQAQACAVALEKAEKALEKAERTPKEY